MTLKFYLLKLTGCAFLAIGLWILFVKHSFASLLGNSTFPIATYLMIGIGGFIVVAGIMGCAGARVENRCLLVLVSYLFFNNPMQILYSNIMVYFTQTPLTE